MRKEDFYDVFEYGDRLEPGVELKIEHSITMEYDTPDLTPFTNSDVKELESLRKISAGTEQKIFDSLKEPLSKWERQAALTKLLDRAIQYLKMPEVEHTSNQWMHDDRSDRDKISNRVYQMSVSVYEDYKYDRQTRERISCASRLAPFDIKEVREITMYDELDLDMLGDERTALFLIMSDTDGTFAFLSALRKSLPVLCLPPYRQCGSRRRWASGLPCCCGFSRRLAASTVRSVLRSGFVGLG